MIQKLKGQSSIEFLAVVGIALLIAAPFIGSVESSILDTQTTSDGITLKNTMDELEAAINTVAVEGEPSKRTFDITLPDDTDEFEVREGVVLVITLDRPEGESEVFRIMNTPITDPDEHQDLNLPQTPGRYEMEIAAWQGQVNVTTAD